MCTKYYLITCIVHTYVPLEIQLVVRNYHPSGYRYHRCKTMMTRGTAIIQHYHCYHQRHHTTSPGTARAQHCQSQLQVDLALVMRCQGARALGSRMSRRKRRRGEHPAPPQRTCQTTTITRGQNEKTDGRTEYKNTTYDIQSAENKYCARSCICYIAVDKSGLVQINWWNSG